MALTVAELNAKLSADTSDFTSAIDKAEKKSGDSFRTIGSTMTKLVSLPLAAMGGIGVKAASDLNESMSKVSVVFGDNAKVIERWSKGSAKNMGVSQQAALEAAGTMGNLFGALGLSADASVNMSKGVVQLAADLGSFNNIRTEDALEKLRAGLVGEVEPLRALGVNLTAATVEAKALEMGLVGADGELSESAKVQARLALITEQTATAHGDFARTADGLANSTKTARAEAENAAATLGTSLQPITAKMATIVGDLAGAFAALPGPIQTAILVAGGIAMIAGPIATVIGLVKSWQLVTLAQTAAQWLLNAALTANPIGVVVMAIAALVAGFVLAYKNSEAFRNIVDGAVRAVGAAAIWVKDRFVDLWNFIAALPGKIAGVAGNIARSVTSMIPGSGIIGGIVGRLPGFADGGVVPGPRGAPMPAIVHGGETVVPAGGGGGGGSQQPIVVQLVADGKVIQEILLSHQRRSGALGLT